MRAGSGGLADRWRAGLLILAFGLALPVGYAGPLGFVPLAGAAGLLALPVLWTRGRAAWLIAPLLALCLWAAISMGWSPAARGLGVIDDYAELESLTALKLVLQLAAYAAVVLAADALSPRAARAALAVLGFTVVMLTVAVFVEALTGAGFYQAIRVALDDPIRPDLAAKNVGQAAFVVAALFWPAALALIRFDSRAAALVGATALLATMGALMFGAFAPALAIVAGLAVYALVAAAPRVGALLCALGSVGFTLAAPFLLGAIRLPPGIPESWTARLNIWTFSAERVLERPWFGWGLDASRTFGPAVPLHPHGAALQAWLELGLVGAAILAVFWGAVFWFASIAAEDDRPAGAAWAATATSYYVIGSLSFGVWQEWWLALGAIAFAAALALRRAWPAEARREDLAPLQAL